MLGRCGPLRGGSRPCLSEFHKVCAASSGKLGQAVSSSLAKVWSFGPHRPQFGTEFASFGRVRAEYHLLGQRFNNCWATVELAGIAGCNNREQVLSLCDSWPLQGRGHLFVVFVERDVANRRHRERRLAGETPHPRIRLTKLTKFGLIKFGQFCSNLAKTWPHLLCKAGGSQLQGGAELPCTRGTHVGQARARGTHSRGRIPPGPCRLKCRTDLGRVWPSSDLPGCPWGRIPPGPRCPRGGARGRGS